MADEQAPKTEKKARAKPVPKPYILVYGTTTDDDGEPDVDVKALTKDGMEVAKALMAAQASGEKVKIKELDIKRA